jgi:hypothetical protein
VSGGVRRIDLPRLVLHDLCHANKLPSVLMNGSAAEVPSDELAPPD